MLSVLLTVLNPALKPFYDAFYKVFLMVRSARVIDVICGIHISGRHPIPKPRVFRRTAPRTAQQTDHFILVPSGFSTYP